MTDAWAFSGGERLRFDHPRDFEPPIRLAALAHVDRRIASSLAHPIAAPPLRELAHGAGRVVIAIPDGSRPCPSDLLLPPLLTELEAAGVDDEQMLVLVACGLHRSTSADEKARLLGPVAAARVPSADAQALAGDHVFLGTTREGIPVWVDPHVARADLTIAIGVVEPHLYAGFSGGVKTVAIGCGGDASIASTHDPRFLDRPAVRLGRLAGNPFQETVREMARHTSLRFAVNVVLNADARVADLVAGAPVAAQERLVRLHDRSWLRDRAGPYDLVVAGIPAPKHESLYQASRAATYLALGERPALADGGLILLCADLPLGVGDGPAERHFGELMAAATEPRELLERGRRGPLGPGGQRAYMMAKVLSRYRVGVLGAADPALPGTLGLASYRSFDEALRDVQRRRREPARVLVVADAIATVVGRGA